MSMYVIYVELYYYRNLSLAELVSATLSLYLLSVTLNSIVFSRLISLFRFRNADGACPTPSRIQRFKHNHKFSTKLR